MGKIKAINSLVTFQVVFYQAHELIENMAFRASWISGSQVSASHESLSQVGCSALTSTNPHICSLVINVKSHILTMGAGETGAVCVRECVCVHACVCTYIHVHIPGTFLPLSVLEFFSFKAGGILKGIS